MHREIANEISDDDSRIYYCIEDITVEERNETDLENKASKPKLNVIKTRESTQMNMFVNKFISPGIQDTSPLPTPRSIRRVTKKETSFNLLIAGEKGLGQSTFIRILIENNSAKKDSPPTYVEDKENIIEIDMFEKSYHLIRDNQKICLNILSIPEFGGGMKSDSSFLSILKYVDETFKNCFKLECALDRSSREDKTIHCCVYFISPYGHGLKPLDIQFLKMFQKKFNIIPVIAKSDIFTKSELDNFKSRVLKEFQNNNIQLFEYSYIYGNVNDELEEILNLSEELKEKIPLCIIASNETKFTNRKKERIRQYPWGVIKTDDPEMSGFVFLENILLKSHINFFKIVTKFIHYENFRVQYILDHVNQGSATENKTGGQAV